MSIISLGRSPGYPNSDQTLNGKRLVHTVEDQWKLQVDSDTEYDNAIFVQLPWTIGAYFGSSDARLKRRKLRRDANARRLFYLDLSFTSEFDEEAEEDKDKPPDQRKAEWAWDFETTPIVFSRDAQTDDPVANSVDEPFEVTTDFVIPVLTIEKFQASFDPDTIINYVNRVNENEFWGAPAGSALLAGIRDRKDSQEVWAGVAYRRVTYVIKFKLPNIPDVIEGWKEIYMDVGTRYLDSGAYKKFMAGNSPTTGKLNTDGTARTPGQAPLFLKFNKHKEADFDTLGIDYDQIT